MFVTLIHIYDWSPDLVLSTDVTVVCQPDTISIQKSISISWLSFEIGSKNKSRQPNECMNNYNII